jgi:uncharacterized protein (TIGR03067 family)
MKMKRLIAILALLALMTSVARSDPMEDAVKAVIGNWSPVEFRQGGKQTVPPELLRFYRLTITKDKFILTAPEGNEVGTSVVRPDKNPKEIDITGTAGPSKGRTFLGIYEVVNGQLRICYDVTGKQRPTEFRDLPDGTTLLSVFRR